MKVLINSLYQWCSLIACLAKVVIIEADHFKLDGISNLQTAIQDAVRTSATHNVFVVTDNSEFDNDDSEDLWIREIITAVTDSVVNKFPTQITTVEGLSSIRLPSLLRATSRSLVIYILTSEDELTHIYPIISSPKHTPKLLFITIYPEQLKSLVFLFREMFEEEKVLDCTVIEVRGYATPKVSGIVHQYNPFNKNYTRQPLTMNITDWFPNKLQNLHGYTVGIQPFHFCAFKTNFENIFKLQGVHAETFYALRDVMNFVIEETEQGSEDMSCVPIILRYYSTYETVIDHTVTFEMDRKCLVIPRIPRKQHTISVWGLLGSLLVGAIIVIIFWAVSVLLKVDERLRHPFNTISLILGVSIAVEPKRLVEKILFIFLVMASTRYTAMFYTELYKLAVIEESELDITSFEDLDQSGIPFAINKYEIDGLSDDMPETLKDRMQHLPNLHYMELPEFISRNTSAFMIGPLAEMYTAVKGPDRKPVMKRTDFCILTYFSSYPLFRVRIYRDRMNDIFLRVWESGMRQKWSQRLVTKDKSTSYAKYVGRESVIDVFTEPSPSDSLIIFYLFYAFLIPWTVFFMEVIHGWWSKRKRMNKRRSRFPMNLFFRKKRKPRRIIILNV